MPMLHLTTEMDSTKTYWPFSGLKTLMVAYNMKIKQRPSMETKTILKAQNVKKLSQTTVTTEKDNQRRNSLSHLSTKWIKTFKITIIMDLMTMRIVS